MVLSACATNNSSETESTIPSTTQTTAPTTITTKPTEPPIPTPAEVIDGTYIVINEKYPNDEIELFYYYNSRRENNKDDSIEILHTATDGKENSTYLAYDAAKKHFIYTINGVGHTYDYLLYTPFTGQPEDDFDILHILLVSDNPDATYLDTLDKENPTAIIVYARFVTLDKSLDSYGDIPTIVKQEGIDLRESSSADFLKDSYFMEDTFNDGYPKILNDVTTVHRFDYSGNLLCSVTLPGYSSELDYCELPDGGFVMSYVMDRVHNLARYDADGEQLWVQDFSTAAVVDFHVVDDVIYCFGRSDERDITSTTLTLDGEILSEKIILNGTYSFLHVIPEEDGFKIYATNSNGTGDIPYRRFCVWFDLELNVVKYEEDNSIHNLYPRGYLNGKPIFQDDPIFNYHPNEIFPENVNNDFRNYNYVGPAKIFAYQDGYIIMRTHYMDVCFFTQNDNTPFYYENIFTYYDSNGVPQWQYVTPIYLA